MPRHRLIDAAVLAPNAPAAAPRIAVGEQGLARRFATSVPPSVEVDPVRGAREHRLVPAPDRRAPPRGGCS